MPEKRNPNAVNGSTTVISDLATLPALLTMGETAGVLRVGRSWVYEHSGELGAVKLGSGRTAPLRIPREAWRGCWAWARPPRASAKCGCRGRVVSARRRPPGCAHDRACSALG
jgi:hypothetical protein